MRKTYLGCLGRTTAELLPRSRKIRIALTGLLLGWVSASEGQAGVLYGVGRETGQPPAIYRIDKTTAQATRVASLEGQPDTAALAVDAAGVAILSDVFQKGSIDGVLLGRVDLETGAVHPLLNPDSTGAPGISGLAFGADGSFFGSSRGDAFPKLYRLERNSSLSSLVAAWPGGLQICGLAAASDGRLFAASATDLYTFNGATAALTLIGPHGLPFSQPKFVEQFGLTYDEEDRVLYATDSWFSNPNGVLYRVNPATGAATAIGATGVEISALASVRGVTEIPALGLSGLGLLAGLLALGAVGLLLRRSI